MNFEQTDKSIETRLGALEQMLGQMLAEQMVANANGGAVEMNVPVTPVITGGGSCCAFQLNGNEVGEGGYFRARTFYHVDGTTLQDLSNYSGYIVLIVEDGSARIEKKSTVGSPTEEKTEFPLYKLTNGEVVDLRACPHLQMWE